MEKYIQLVQKLYMEPKDEDILGSLLQVETTGTDDVAKVPRAVLNQKREKISLKSKQKTFGFFLNATVNKQRIICIKKSPLASNIKRKSCSFGLN